MVEKEIYIVRHGQTDLNAQGIVQGKGVDAPLNELGQKQANAFYEAYKHVPFDALYSSIITAGTHKASSLKVAEAAKVIHCHQRY